MANILTAFNDHFIEFVNDVHCVFPNDADILATKNALTTIRKMKTIFIFLYSKLKMNLKKEKSIKSCCEIREILFIGAISLTESLALRLHPGGSKYCVVATC